MLKKTNRLTKQTDFDNVFKKGRSKFTDFLGVKIVKNDLEVNRFGFIVSGKISKKAVDRNKIKRQLRAVVSKMNIKSSYDIVFITQPKIIEKEFIEIEKAVFFLFTKLGINDTKNKSTG